MGEIDDVSQGASARVGSTGGDQAAPSTAGGEASPLAPTLESESRRRQYVRTAPLEVRTRITLYVLRGVFFLAAAGLGYYTTSLFNWPEKAVIAVVTACGLAVVVMGGEIFFAGAPIRTLSAIAFGLMMGLALSVVFKPVTDFIVSSIAPKEVPREEITKLLQLVTTTIFCYFGVAILIATRDDFKFIIPYVEFRKDVRGHTPLVLDTSMIIDGRIATLLDTRIFDQRLVVPRFVLDELQEIADSPDRSKRERGRRGLDTLQELYRRASVEILERDLPPGVEVDSELVAVAEELRGKLLTTDYNLQQRAHVQTVPVININDLANALKPVVVPGETLRVKLLREGDDPGQAVGFLDDGTMVVVENASRQIGRDVVVDVTSATQTSVGKMIFGRLKKTPPRRPRRPKGRGGSRSTSET